MKMYNQHSRRNALQKYRLYKVKPDLIRSYAVCYTLFGKINPFKKYTNEVCCLDSHISSTNKPPFFIHIYEAKPVPTDSLPKQRFMGNLELM